MRNIVIIKNLIYTVCILFVSSCSSISIVQDYIGDDGTRYVKTNAKPFFLLMGNKEIGYKISVEAVHKHTTNWYVVISSDHNIPSPADVLLKFNDDSIIHLHCDKVIEDTTKIYSSKVKNITNSTIYNFGISSYTSSSSDIEMTENPTRYKIHYSAQFAISPRDFSLLNNKSVIKMRIVAKDKYTKTVYIDGNPFVTKVGSHVTPFSKLLKKYFSKITKKLSTPLPPPNELYDKF